MEVDRLSFYPLLLDILTDISEAHFCSIDLELSGVPSKDSYAPKAQAGKQTLQERYLETKAAAERYQILQLGITCVEQDARNGKYILKPYNFNLCPVINERGLDVERIFSFQSGAVEFLLQVGLDFNKVFQHGVPYLSREEAKIARSKFKQRQDKTALADIQIKPTETESLAFLERVRQEINTWVTCRKMETESYLNIEPLKDLKDADNDTQHVGELSRFEKRLVHQLVRAEYPELVTISKRGFIQIVKFDKQREDRIAEERKRELEERIARQKGLRWIIEALHGTNISSFNVRECAKDTRTGEPIYANLDDLKAQFQRAQARLRSNPRVIIGHNCFLDMVYIYRTFIRELPDTVEEFQQKLHRLWPVVVDTKYMSTHNCGDISPASSLEQIAQQLSSEEKPLIKTEKHHAKYRDAEAFHEAGYDSYLTAQVAVRLSAKLERQGTYVSIDESTNGVKDVTNGVADLQLTTEALQQHDAGQTAYASAQPQNDSVAEHSDSTVTPGRATSTANNIASSWNVTDRSSEPPRVPPPFTPSEPGKAWKRTGDPTLGPIDPNDPFQYNPGDRKHRYRVEEVTIPDGMPKFSSDFWRIYGNKLRVFGTEEGVCLLEPPIEADGEEGGVKLKET